MARVSSSAAILATVGKPEARVGEVGKREGDGRGRSGDTSDVRDGRSGCAAGFKQRQTDETEGRGRGRGQSRLRTLRRAIGTRRRRRGERRVAKTKGYRMATSEGSARRSEVRLLSRGRIRIKGEEYAKDQEATGTPTRRPADKREPSRRTRTAPPVRSSQRVRLLLKGPHPTSLLPSSLLRPPPHPLPSPPSRSGQRRRRPRPPPLGPLDRELA